MKLETKSAIWTAIETLAGLMIILTSEFGKGFYWFAGWLIIAIVAFIKMYQTSNGFETYDEEDWEEYQDDRTREI